MWNNKKNTAAMILPYSAIILICSWTIVNGGTKAAELVQAVRAIALSQIVWLIFAVIRDMI